MSALQLSLPRTLSSDIRFLLERTIHAGTLEQLFYGVGGVLLRYLNASYMLFFCELDESSDSVCAPDTVRFAITRLEDVPEDVLEWLPQRWIDVGIHRALSAELGRGLSCVSYSGYSWPYGQVDLSEYPQFGRSDRFPGAYSLCVPLSSECIVRLESEPRFSGYLVYMFETFPEIHESLVQLIVLLPTLLSDIAAACMRARRPDTYIQELRSTCQ